MTSTSIVCAEIVDCAVGSDVGVDDHAFKFHDADEASVWSWVSSC